MSNSSKTGDTAYSAAKEAETLYTNGMEALRTGDALTALNCFGKAVGIERRPLYLSNLAFCLAKEKREFPRAISLCKEAIKHDPRNSVHFLYLGRIHLLAGQKKDAIRIFRMGLRNEKNQEIARELERLGNRKEPVLPFLERGNPLNKYLGIILKKAGIR